MASPSSETLAKIPLLQALEPELLAQLAAAMQLKELAKQDFLMHKGERGDELVFLLEGRLLAVDITPEGKQTGLNFLTPGDFLGELAIIDDLPRSATVVAIAPSMVALLPKAHAKKMIFENPVIAERMLRHISLKLRATTDFRALLGIPNAFQRVLSLMEMLAKLPNKTISAEGGINMSTPPMAMMGPMASEGWYFFSNMMGVMERPNMAVVAMVEPEMAEKAVPATTETTGSRAGTR
jgi:CRP-like cAMP-binding protein